MKKLLVQIIFVIAFIFLLSACSGKIVARIDNEPINESEIEEYLEGAKREILKDQIYSKLIREFYSEITLSEEEIQEQLGYMKRYYSATEWENFLAYHGYKDESEFKKFLEIKMKQAKKLEQLEDEVTISDDAAKELFEQNPGYYQYADVDAIFFESREQKNDAWEMAQQGYTLEEIAEKFLLTVSRNEKAPVTYTEFESRLEECQAGDIIKTKDTSSDHVIAKINKVCLEYENVKDIVKENYLSTATENELVQKIKEFFMQHSIEIMGEKIDPEAFVDEMYSHY